MTIPARGSRGSEHRMREGWGTPARWAPATANSHGIGGRARLFHRPCGTAGASRKEIDADERIPCLGERRFRAQEARGSLVDEPDPPIGEIDEEIGDPREEGVDD